MQRRSSTARTTLKIAQTVIQEAIKNSEQVVRASDERRVNISDDSVDYSNEWKTNGNITVSPNFSEEVKNRYFDELKKKLNKECLTTISPTQSGGFWKIKIDASQYRAVSSADVSPAKRKTRSRPGQRNDNGTTEAEKAKKEETEKKVKQKQDRMIGHVRERANEMGLLELMQRVQNTNIFEVRGGPSTVTVKPDDVPYQGNKSNTTQVKRYQIDGMIAAGVYKKESIINVYIFQDDLLAKQRNQTDVWESGNSRDQYRLYKNFEETINVVKEKNADPCYAINGSLQTGADGKVVDTLKLYKNKFLITIERNRDDTSKLYFIDENEKPHLITDKPAQIKKLISREVTDTLFRRSLEDVIKRNSRVVGNNNAYLLNTFTYKQLNEVDVLQKLTFKRYAVDNLPLDQNGKVSSEVLRNAYVITTKGKELYFIDRDGTPIQIPLFAGEIRGLVARKLTKSFSGSFEEVINRYSKPVPVIVDPMINNLRELDAFNIEQIKKIEAIKERGVGNTGVLQDGRFPGQGKNGLCYCHDGHGVESLGFKTAYDKRKLTLTQLNKLIAKMNDVNAMCFNPPNQDQAKNAVLSAGKVSAHGQGTIVAEENDSNDSKVGSLSEVNPAITAVRNDDDDDDEKYDNSPTFHG